MRFSRTEMLLGQKAMSEIKKKKVLVLGIGGVGTHAVEALARTGIGSLTLVDHDLIAVTNINRQLHSLESTVGRAKVEVMQERVKDINPVIDVKALQEFYSPDRGDYFLTTDYDFVIDAVDNVSAKLDIITRCKTKNIPIISSMGAGNKINPLTLTIDDISKTTACPLARVVRRELRKKGISNGVPVVYSPDTPLQVIQESTENIPPGKNSIPGSISFVPAVAGYYLAYYVISYFVDSVKVRSE
ncbi:MAG: thiamine biosynthesis protein ThiF [Desulfitibacter sp. BRH_c19]|nr:MAG: thiamine biosynthesis protein ThiF [Desulfitibacter sp. BRH_c19]